MLISNEIGYRFAVHGIFVPIDFLVSIKNGTCRSFINSLLNSLWLHKFSVFINRRLCWQLSPCICWYIYAGFTSILAVISDCMFTY